MGPPITLKSLANRILLVNVSAIHVSERFFHVYPLTGPFASDIFERMSEPT